MGVLGIFWARPAEAIFLMASTSDPKFGVNSWFEDELYQQYLHDRRAVDESWKGVFEAHTTPAAAVVKTPPTLSAGSAEQLVPLRGAALRIVENMEQSLAIPTATSQRTIPVKVIDENRQIINQYRTLLGKGKISYTHIIGWAIVQALKENPTLNNAYAEKDGEAFRLVRGQIHLGLAVDVAGKDGNRSLMVPNLKDAGSLNFHEYLAAFDDIVDRARRGKLTLPDFQGTSISLTNPGTVGTVASVPRLMPGQGCIIATGAIGYPAEYSGVTPEIRATLGLSKVMTMTCTYDHRVIQGAESGLFLAKVQDLLQGGGGFYERMFADLHLPHQPVRWEPDRTTTVAGQGGSGFADAAKMAAVLQLVNAYRVRGHLIADLDPLGSEPGYHPELDPSTYGLTIWDLDREFLTGSLGEALGDGRQHSVATLREILETVRQSYCGKIGCEYMNIQHPEQKLWIQRTIETGARTWSLPAEKRQEILERLITAEEFEHFLHSRYIGHKRFSLEGAETVVAILDHLLDIAADTNVHEIVIGMAHRGRLNVLANVVGKPLNQIFAEFEGNDPGTWQGSGDVKYHLGATGVHSSGSNHEIVVSVSPNPSHLEAVNPVVEGIVRPKQDRLGDTERARVIPLLVHGDAAFAGQGVVAETLNLSQLDGYCTGGTIHLIINNQIGFTTGPADSRSSPYSTDVARTVQAPIFHVNGEDPDAAIRVAQIAFDYRRTFKKDVVIDMFCYRRHGHNETDDPSYTQPLMYRKIRQRSSIAVIYGDRLVREKAITEAEREAMRKRIIARLAEAFDEVKKSAERYEYQELSALAAESLPPASTNTSISRDMIGRIVEGITTFPATFHLHPKLQSFIDKRKQVLAGAPLDWAMGESLAFGSLVLEGTPVRLSGQDSGRGTFSQRHLEYIDYEDGGSYVPMKHLASNQARFEVWDSSLSEYAVMGFEFGYSVADPLTLVLWEAQFGDFVNGAQIMIDQFLAAAESKWSQPSGLTLLLPHGYEGQGPEHSSARIERFLTLCAENNLQVCNCTTPAQYFHLLRRQMHGGQDRRGVRKPLIVFTPKSLLRHAQAVSALDAFTTGGFREVLNDLAMPRPDRVTRVLLCSGKVYYDLIAARTQRNVENAAIVRLEQFYPFPLEELRDVLMRYPLSAELVWVQEEPRNMGPWRFVREKMEPLLESPRRELGYAGRPESASTATGSAKRHQEEQADLIEEAFAPGPIVRKRRVRVLKTK